MTNWQYRPEPQDGYSRDEEEAYQYAREAEQRQDEREEETNHLGLGWVSEEEEEEMHERHEQARVDQYFNARHDWKAGEGPHPRGW
jgi:hypothetical protein